CSPVAHCDMIAKWSYSLMTLLSPMDVSRLESARQTRILRSASFVRSILSAKGPSSFTVRRGRGALDRKLQCNGGTLAGARLDLQAATDELGSFAHRQESDRLRAARRLHEVEADPVVGDMKYAVTR